MPSLHPIRDQFFKEAFHLAWNQIGVPLVITFSGLGVAYFRGDLVSFKSGLITIVLWLSVGVVAYAVIALARAPFVVLAKHEGRLMDNESEISSILKPAQILKDELDQCNGKLETAESELVTLRKIAADHREIMKQWAEPMGEAANQRRNVSRWVVVEDCLVEESQDSCLVAGSETFIEFTLKVFNGCLFKVIFENQTNGHITYLSVRDDVSIRLLEYTPEVKGGYLAPGCSGKFKIRQRLHRDDLAFIVNDLEQGKFLSRFSFANLQIFISNNMNSSTLGRQTLSFPDQPQFDVTIAEVTETRAGILKRFNGMIAHRLG